MNKTLTSNTSPETAYVVEDYPYGFTLRTKIRYWVETKPGFGQRFVSQTLNPKTGAWNKPKAGNYSTLVAVYLDEKGYVQNAGWNPYRSVEELLAFGRDYALDAYQRRLFAAIVDRYVAAGVIKQEAVA